MNSLTDNAAPMPADWRDLLALTKPRVMSLVVFTALCGMLAAPVTVHPVIGFAGILAVALGAGAAGALNMWYEADIDGCMRRTRSRPLPAGRMTRDSALQFGVGLSCFSVLLMQVAVGWLAAAILALSILFYVIVYTMWLKPRTPQNIVIGGAAGAFPPVIGWAIATGDVTLMPVFMFLLIFLWTPPHFWSLALFVKADYSAAGVPMMPVVAGETSTRNQILGYSVVMAIAAVLPWPLGLTGPVYGVVAGVLSAAFLVLAARVAVPAWRGTPDMTPEKRLFALSISYLFLLFAAAVADRLVA